MLGLYFFGTQHTENQPGKEKLVSEPNMEVPTRGVAILFFFVYFFCLILFIYYSLLSIIITIVLLKRSGVTKINVRK